MNDPDKDPQAAENEPEHIGGFVRLIVKTLKSRDVAKFKEWVSLRLLDGLNAQNLLSICICLQEPFPMNRRD